VPRASAKQASGRRGGAGHDPRRHGHDRRRHARRRAVVGIFTDGDLRRALEKVVDLKGTPVTQVMTRNPRTIGPDRLAAETAQMMEEYKISQILVVENGALVGALNTHDLFRAKVI
jgi:arabinose-5-phosphate isomerase